MAISILLTHQGDKKIRTVLACYVFLHLKCVVSIKEYSIYSDRYLVLGGLRKKNLVTVGKASSVFIIEGLFTNLHGIYRGKPVFTRVLASKKFSLQTLIHGIQHRSRCKWVQMRGEVNPTLPIPNARSDCMDGFVPVSEETQFQWFCFAFWLGETQRTHTCCDFCY